MIVCQQENAQYAAAVVRTIDDDGGLGRGSDEARPDWVVHAYMNCRPMCGIHAVVASLRMCVP